jgi:L-malate glycosyltransferase
MPLAIVMANFHPGGTERQMIELLRRLDRSRFEVHLACIRAEGAWFDRAAEAAVSVGVFPLRSFARPHALQHLWAFSRWCRARHIAVVHTSELYSNIFGLPAAAAAGVAVRIGNRREIAAGKSRSQIALQRSAYTFAHCIVANAEAAAARLRREYVPPSKIRVVPNGLDLDRFTAAAHRPSTQRIAIVANLRPEKGHDTLIDAAPAVLARFPGATFDVVGAGPEREALVARARARGVAQAFAFSGHAEDVLAHLREADVFVLPSRTEAFPNAILEAMAAGVPVVASAVGGILEVVRDDVTGLLVPADRPDVLAHRVNRLLGESLLRERLAAAGRALVVERYSFERMVNDFEHLYVDQLTARVQPGARAQWAAL